MNLALLRNFGIAAHIDAGKTTVSEHILYCAGTEHRVGQVDHGTTILDWLPEERERGITISSAASTVPWRGHALTLIDTPGHVDFTVEVERCMRVLDGAVLVLDAVAGVQAQSETVWRQIRANAIPALAFVNKCDRVGADFPAAVKSIRSRLGVRAQPIHLPFQSAEHCAGVIDLVQRKAWLFDQADRAREVPVPVDLQDDLELWRAELIDELSNLDEALLEVTIEAEEPTAELLRSALRRATLAQTLLPVLAGAALRGVGIPLLLDAIVDYLPSPLDRPPIRVFDASGQAVAGPAPDAQAPLLALAFKIHASAHGDLTFVRLYAGTVRAGDKVWNPRCQRMERIARVLRMHGEGGQALEHASAGEIVALTGLKFSASGDTLCDRALPLGLEPLRFPDPVLSLVVEPASAADRDRLRQALQRIAHEDPSFHAREDESLGQWTIEGMGELHLEICLQRLRREHQLEPRVGPPRVSYREAVCSEAGGQAIVERMLGSTLVYGAVEVWLGPGPAEGGTTVRWASDCAVPQPYRVAIAEAIASEAQTGPSFGFPLMGCTIEFRGGESRPASDHESAYIQAAVQAFRQALGQARCAILEPLMRFMVDAPEDFSSGILADLASRGATIAEVRAGPGSLSIAGEVPLHGMFGYATVVRSLSQGRASFTLAPAGYREVEPRSLQARGLAQA